MDRLILCGSCAEGRGAGMARALESRLPDGVVIEFADCLNACGDPIAMALRGPGKDVYLFAGVAADDVGDVTALARLYAEAADGRIRDARPAGRLRQCLLGRVPGRGARD